MLSIEPQFGSLPDARPFSPGSPAAEKVAELLLDEPQQPFPDSQTSGLRADSLEVIDQGERTLRGTPMFVCE